MSTWTQQQLQKHMHVYSSDNIELGHVAETYEDSFLVKKGIIFPKDRYIPYNAIARIDHDQVYLTMNTDEALQREWEKRPDYEDHPADPTQLLYDRGHGVHDPFDETAPDQA